MANATKTDIKFGVVHTSPTNLITNAASLEDGKLYFAAGDASGLVKQGIYGVVGVTTDGSIDIDGDVNGKQLAMFGTGAVADGTGYGLSQANFTTDEKNKLAAFGNASTYLTTIDASTNYLKIEDASYFRTVKVDNTLIVADSSKDALEFVAGSNIMITPDASNDKITISATDTVYTGNDPISVNELTISHANSGVTAGRYGDTSSKRELVFGGKFKVVDISVNEYGHVTDASTYELTLPSKPDTAGTADVANKLNKKLSINGIDFDGSTDVSLSVKGDGKTIDVSTLDGSVVIKAVTSDVSTNSSALTTGAQVANYVSTELGKLSGALIYKGVITAYSQLPSADASNIGHVYICSSSFTTTEAETGVKYSIEVGDMFISNGSKWNIVSSEFDVSTYSDELQWSTDVSIAVVDGVTIKAKLPANPNTDYQATKDGHYTPSDEDASVATTANGTVEWSGAVVTGVTKDSKGHITGVTTSTIPGNPNTDEKVKANTSTGKFYLIGQDDASSGTTETTYKNASVYVDGSALYSEGKKVLTGYTEQYTGTVKWVYPGTGLTDGTSDSSITSTGTLNLKIATSNEIGGVKPGTTNATNKTYGVNVDATTGEMTVNVPWTDNNDNTWRDVYVSGTKILITETNSGSLKFVNGTNITATWNSTDKTIQFDASGLATTEQVEAATICWETL